LVPNAFQYHFNTVSDFFTKIQNNESTVIINNFIVWKETFQDNGKKILHFSLKSYE